MEQRKQQLRDLLKQVQAEIQKSKEIAEQAKTEVQAQLEHLQVQLALGKAEAREAFEKQRTKILKALSEFESIADEKLKGAAFESGKLWEDLVGRASTLEAEFEALTNRFECEERKGVGERKGGGSLFSRVTAVLRLCRLARPCVAPAISLALFFKRGRS